MNSLAGYAIGQKDINAYLVGFDYEFAILEKQDDIRFLGKDKIDAAGDLVQWDKGRLFGQNGEVKWVRKTNGFHVVAVKDNGRMPVGVQTKEIKSIGERRVFLWGEYVTQTDKSADMPAQWYELRIPRFIEYPFKPSKRESRIRLIIKEYGFDDGSSIHRYAGLEEAFDGNQESL